MNQDYVHAPFEHIPTGKYEAILIYFLWISALSIELIRLPK
jgi:hypothetical protein